MPIRPRCLITAFVNSNCIAFVASFQRTSTSSFTEPSSHLSPSRSVDLCSIYVHYCKSSIASCALVKTLFHWLSIIVHQSKSLLIGCCDSVHWSWTTPSEWHVICMVSLLSREPVYQRKIVHWLISVPFIESLHRFRRRKVLVYWKRLEARSTVRVPRVERNLWKAAKILTEYRGITIMVSKNCPITSEHVGVIFVAQ